MKMTWHKRKAKKLHPALLNNILHGNRTFSRTTKHPMFSKPSNKVGYIVNGYRRLKIENEEEKTNPICFVNKNIRLRNSSINNVIIFTRTKCYFTYHCFPLNY